MKGKIALIFFLAALSISVYFTYQNYQVPSCYNCNIVLISLDSLRADHLSSYGYEKNTSPNIDEIASQGILFKNYITQAYLTPISEFSMQTSLYPHEHGLAVSNRYGQAHSLSNPPETIASILSKYGYYTAAFSSSPEFNYWTEFKNGFNSFQYVGYRIVPEINESYLQGLKDRKFFLWLAIGTVHAPYGRDAPNATLEKYMNPDYNGIFENTDPELNVILSIYNNTYYPTYDVGGDSQERNYSLNASSLNQQDLNYIVNRYDAGIEYVDQYVGNISQMLKDSGLDKNTIVIITSAHGEEFGEHGYVMHYDIHDEETHVPLIIKLPGLKHEVIDPQVQSLDVLPTILDLLKIPQYQMAEGHSLVPLMSGNNSDYDKYVFIERTPFWEEFVQDNLTPTVHYDFAIRTNEWKLIYRQGRDFEMNYSWYGNLTGKKISIPEFELYNLKNDTLELHNVYTSNPDVANELKTQLFNWLKNVNQATIFNRTEINVTTIFPYP